MRTILYENRDYVERGYTDDVNIGYELIQETDKKDYFLDTDLEVTLGIILRSIQALLEKIQINFDETITNEVVGVIKAYQEYKALVLREQQYLEIEEFEKKYEEELNKMENCYNYFLKMKENMSESTLNLINAIDEYISSIGIQNHLDFEGIDYDKIETFINSITAQNKELNIDMYRRFNILARIEKEWREYNKYNDLDIKKITFEKLSYLLNQYINLNTKYEEKEYTNLDRVTKNDIYYLNLENGINSIINYIDSDQDYTSKTFRQILRGIDKIAEYDPENLYLATKPVKNSPYGEKVRRLRTSNCRVLYININNIVDLNLKLNRNCYVIIAAGIKWGESKIYDYAYSAEVVRALKQLAKYLEDNIGVINKKNISEQAKNEEIQKFMDTIIQQNNAEFENIKNKFKMEAILTESMERK